MWFGCGTLQNPIAANVQIVEEFPEHNHQPRTFKGISLLEATTTTTNGVPDVSHRLLYSRNGHKPTMTLCNIINF